MRNSREKKIRCLTEKLLSVFLQAATSWPQSEGSLLSNLPFICHFSLGRYVKPRTCSGPRCTIYAVHQHSASQLRVNLHGVQHTETPALILNYRGVIGKWKHVLGHTRASVQDTESVVGKSRVSVMWRGRTAGHHLQLPNHCADGPRWTRSLIASENSTGLLSCFTPAIHREKLCKHKCLQSHNTKKIKNKK